MKIEIRGIMQRYDEGNRIVDLMVTEDKPDKYRRLRMGVDIKVNRGRILTFLKAFYSVGPGDIVWPDHIQV